MRVLRWLVFSILTIAFSTATLTRNEKLTLEIDEEEDARSTITFEPAVVHALRQPHSLDDLLQREEWRDELQSLDMITSSFKDTADLDVDRLNAEELVRQEDPSCANLPPLLDEEANLLIYPTTQCDPTNCLAPCNSNFVDELENLFSEKSEENAKDDGQEPFCDEFFGSTDGDDELVQSVNGHKQLEVLGTSKCTVNSRALTEALRTKYKPVETLHHAAFYWLSQNEPSHAIYCLQSVRRQPDVDAQRVRDAQFLVAQLLFHAKRNKASLLLLNWVATTEQPSAIALRVLASRLLYADNCTAALPIFEAASKLDNRLQDDNAFNTEYEFCRCRNKVIGLLGQEQRKLQRQLDELNAYNDAMERELHLHSLINSRTISKQKFSDSWLAFSHIKFGPLPGLKCADTTWSARKHRKLQCKITNLLDYFGTTVKKLENYRLSLEELDEHEEHLQRYDEQRQRRESESAAEMDKFVEQLRPYVGLKIDNLIVEPNQRKSDSFGLFQSYDKANRMQTAQKICNSKHLPGPSTTSNFMFLSLISRGYPIRDLLNKYLNLAPNQIHPLPWDLPYCQAADARILNQTLTGQNIFKLKSIQQLMEIPELYSAESELLPHVADLLGLKSNADLLLGDFGQRIRTLMQFRIGPEWLHRELAAFLFRCLGLFREAFDCLAQNLVQSRRLPNEGELDITLSQLYNLIRGLKQSEGDQFVLLLLMHEYNKDAAHKEAAIRYQIGRRLRTSDAHNYLWNAFEIDPSYRPALSALREYYCNKNIKIGQPIQNRYAPICCWQTEHDVYCFKEPSKKGACFKIETRMVDDRVEHRFWSFRCSGPYVAQSFAPPPLARFVVGFIHPAIEYRDQLVNAKIDEFLKAELQYKYKKDKLNAKKVFPLDYGGYSKHRLSQFLPKFDDTGLLLETKAYIETEFGASTDREIVRNGELRFSAVTDNSIKQKAEVKFLGAIDETDGQSFHFYRMWNGDAIQVEGIDEENPGQRTGNDKSRVAWRLVDSNTDVDFSQWQEIIRVDAPRPVNIPHPDPKLVANGMQIYQMPTPNEITKFCEQRRLSHLLEPVSTYLSISVKGVNIETLIDRDAKISSGQKLDEPLCLPQATDYKRLFHGLPGSQFSDRIKVYKPEKALRDALLSMGATHDSVETIGHRLAVAMKKLGRVENSQKGYGPYWALTTAAALYWRVKGNAHAAITCLIQSLDHAPRHMEDVAALSLANIYHQTGFLHSALISGHYALQASGGSIVGVHFTLANIFASMGEHKLAEQFYFSTLALQSNFQAAKDRLIALKCLTK